MAHARGAGPDWLLSVQLAASAFRSIEVCNICYCKEDLCCVYFDSNLMDSLFVDTQ